MIHEVTEDILNINKDILKQYRLITFDDGLYSQYKHIEFFKSLDIPLIFFISTNIINTSNVFNHNIICSTAHDNFFNNNDVSSYMSTEQIKEIYYTNNCYIGFHSHNHTYHKISKKFSLNKLYTDLVLDTELGKEFFKEHNMKFNLFCYPYNKELPLYELILKRNGIKHLYGKGRKDIQELIKD